MQNVDRRIIQMKAEREPEGWEQEKKWDKLKLSWKMPQ